MSRTSRRPKHSGPAARSSARASTTGGPSSAGASATYDLARPGHRRERGVRRLSHDGRAVQLALVPGPVERRRTVQRAAVVPHHRIAVAPGMAVDELRLRAERRQLVEHRPAFLWRHPDDLLRVRTDVERLAAVD